VAKAYLFLELVVQAPELPLPAVLVLVLLVLPQVCQNSHSERVPLLPTPLPD
jgi:hypothetical protein